MSQITLYLDDETEALVVARAKASGMSRSRWVAEVIRRHARASWPVEFRDLAGAFPDFPLVEELPDLPADLPRIQD